VPLAFAADQKGILPDHMIAALAAAGGILPAADFLPDQIQPASLDLRLGEVAYRVRASSATARCWRPIASTSCR
jgi:dCTP deaminase